MNNDTDKSTSAESAAQEKAATLRARRSAFAMIGEGFLDVYLEEGLRPIDLMVLAIHALRFNGDPGSSYPSTASVARMTKKDASTIIRSRQRLVRAGLLIVHTAAHGPKVAKYSVNDCNFRSQSYRGLI